MDNPTIYLERNINKDEFNRQVIFNRLQDLHPNHEVSSFSCRYFPEEVRVSYTIHPHDDLERTSTQTMWFKQA
jgi:hypothetical protein